MTDINRELGLKIRSFRKKRSLTLAELAELLHKSKATVSKYERGDITIDVATLYELAATFNVQIEQLLFIERENNSVGNQSVIPAFFSGVSQFFSYLYDGRSNQIIRCVFDIIPTSDEKNSTIFMYMNFKEYEHYQNCENSYQGKIEHFDALTNIVMYNQDTYMEQVTVSILASFLNSTTKWGLFFGISSRPLMPIATKMLFSKTILKEDPALIEQLKISKEDIRLMKHYNMFSAT